MCWIGSRRRESIGPFLRNCAGAELLRRGEKGAHNPGPSAAAHPQCASTYRTSGTSKRRATCQTPRWRAGNLSTVDEHIIIANKVENTTTEAQQRALFIWDATVLPLRPLLFKGREMPLLPTAVDRKSCSAITTTTRTRKWLCNPVHSPFWLSVCLSFCVECSGKPILSAGAVLPVHPITPPVGGPGYDRWPMCTFRGACAAG